MTATKRLAKAAAVLVIVFMTVNNLLLHDESNNNLRRQQQNSTSDVMTTSSIVAGEEESLDQFTLRVLNRRDKERRMDDSRLGGITQQNRHTNDGIICGRPANLGTSTPKESDCPGLNSNTILLLEGTQTYGRTGNQLIEFLHALQYARDNDIILGVKYGSWAMRLLNRMWLAVADVDQSEWEVTFQNSFCVRIIHSNQELKQWNNVIRMDTKDLLLYKSNASFQQYASFQQHTLRTLFQNYNTGEGTTLAGFPTRSMCEGVDTLFGIDRKSAIYSVIHLRKLEEVGYAILGNVAKHTGCDPRAAIEMRPDYVRTILKPLGMLHHPIVIISDGQHQDAIQRLIDDSEIGPKITLVPQESSWKGGDMMLGILSNVFIGNPASSFSSFIAKSRLAMGKGHNYLFRARDGEGRWQTVCGDSCVFDNDISHF